MRALAKGYSSQVDGLENRQWHRVIRGFDDCNLYQTACYEEARTDASNISHLLLKRGNRFVCAAQVRVAKVPVLGAGLAYVRWGPLWRTGAGDQEIEVFGQVLRALRNEYVCNRHLLLRVFPLLFDREDERFLRVFEDEGYQRRDQLGTERTLLIDLSAELDQIRGGLDRKWRNHLNRAEKNDLEIVEGSDDATWQIFDRLYSEMLERKQFDPSVDLKEFRRAQEKLPDELKMKVFVCKAGGKAGAGVVCSALGSTGLYLFGATNQIGMKSKCSYLLQWRIINWLKDQGLRTYDLHGINPEKNPGTYSFKAGLCGKNGRDVHFLGRFEACGFPLSRLTVRIGESVRRAFK